MFSNRTRRTTPEGQRTFLLQREVPDAELAVLYRASVGEESFDPSVHIDERLDPETEGDFNRALAAGGRFSLGVLRERGATTQQVEELNAVLEVRRERMRS